MADEAYGHGDADSPDPLLTMEVDSTNPSQDDGTAATPINVEAEGGDGEPAIASSMSKSSAKRSSVWLDYEEKRGNGSTPLRLLALSFVA
ncbi:hypothetical protein GUJ93_ZPchr0006g41220 [Zizania palustris]|uniref:Uncharacterized protein n=1 Tax=Zizania palustris TaxID=103762 RepID=A0A8J5T252_ZIZPA|nr:hypothetical protein GUJ93_ZPchr0006g41220 [Zizania palustris]